MFSYTNESENPHFFIQTVGTNAGKPSKEETANSIGIVANELVLVPDYFYFLVLSLWMTGKFKSKQKGSVIPYITQQDISETIFNHFLTKSGDFFFNGALDATNKSQGHG